MKKWGFWQIALAVFAGILVADLAFLALRGYMITRAIDDMNETLTGISASGADSLQRINRQRELQQAQKQRDELDRNTLCAMNTDSGKCVCLHRETGRRISVEHTECVARASQQSLR